MIIEIKKSEFINELEKSSDFFGSHEWSMYTDPEGRLDLRSDAHINTGFYRIYGLSGLGDMADEKENYPDSPDYDAHGVAKWLVDEVGVEFLPVSDIADNGTETIIEIKLK